MSMKAALFDVGYTLMDETPRLEAALDWLVQRLDGLTVDALLGLYAEACVEPGPHPSLLVQMLTSAGIDPSRAEELRRDLPWDQVPLVAYPDAAPALEALRAADVRVGVLANQPASAADDLERAGLLALCDDVWLSEPEGVAKPDPRFFRLALRAWNMRPGAVAYVGDRPDNDVAPANDMGLASVRLRRGPHADQPAHGASQTALIDVNDLMDAVTRIATPSVSP